MTKIYIRVNSDWPGTEHLVRDFYKSSFATVRNIRTGKTSDREYMKMLKIRRTL